ncbi:MAG: hypothetical protein QOJ32_3241 [Frankiaceae bacterium]|jgi:hypothetical protein|nr:hypothetical protein [Frankiaceae bacterium]
MKKRFATILLAVLTTVGLVVAAVPAGAAPAGNSLNDRKLAVTGLVNGKSASGTFRPERAVQQGNGIALIGRLQMKSAGGNVNQRNVAVPVVLPTQPAPAAARAAAPAAAAVTPQAVCQVLNLTLGPLHLNLLGLVVDLNQVVLNLTANPAGGLLGQLLCSLAGGPGGLGGIQGLLTQITTLLNQILAGL